MNAGMNNAIASKANHQLVGPDHFDGPDPDAGTGSRSGGLIKGEKLKFNPFSGEWISGDGTVIAAEREFIVIGLAYVTQKWGPDNRPVETRLLAAGEFFPDIERLNTEAPASEHRMFCGTLKGPWENSKIAYLFDPRLATGFTWITATKGGFAGVTELKTATQHARMLQKRLLFPVVTLTSGPWPTSFGSKLYRPILKISRFEPIGDAPAQSGFEAPKPEEMNDAIVY
jgi:hypothetical protein